MNLAKIGDVVTKAKTWDPRKDASADLIRYIDIGSVSQDTKTIGDLTPILGSEAPSRARQLVQTGDILVSTVRPNLNAVARVPEELDGATASTGFTILRPQTDHVDPAYLFHWVRTADFVAEMMRQATGQSYPAVSDKIVKASAIPLPPLEEQKRIAGILDQAAELCRLRTRALDKLNTLGQAIFHEMFPRDDHGIPRQLLGELCIVVRGSSPRPQGDPRYFGGNVPRLMIADITRDGMLVTPRIDSLTELGAKKSRPMKAGSVVMAVSGAVGLPAILDCDACIHDGFVGFRDLSEKVLPRFLYQVLLAGMAENKARGTGAIWTNLTTDQVRRFDIPTPPIDDQLKFVERMKHLESHRERYLVAEENAISLLASLQYRAFRGEM